MEIDVQIRTSIKEAVLTPCLIVYNYVRCPEANKMGEGLEAITIMLVT
jgi:hypothetical protein